MQKSLKIIAALVASFFFFDGAGQVVAPHILLDHSSFIDVNTAEPQTIYKIVDGVMEIGFKDFLGKSKTIELTVRDWKMDVQGIFTLDKVLGQNRYMFSFADQGIQMDSVNAYHCQMTDEDHHTFQWYVTKLKKIQTQVIPTLTAKPILTNCDPTNPETSITEFYATISGGNAPYTVDWYVVNDSRTQFLYQPKEDTVSMGVIPMISVDSNPSYSVMLLVTDHCGTIGTCMVTVTCQSTDPMINTVFVDPIQNFNNITAPKKITQ